MKRLLTLGAAMLACGCINTSGASAAGAAGGVPSPSSQARVQAKWQQQLLDELAAGKDGVTEAWGLFSAGGWADDGQEMMLASADRKTSRVQIVKAAQKAVGVDRAGTQAEAQAIEKAGQAADQLQDLVIPSFDGLVFEYVHATRAADGSTTVAKRVFIQNPGTKPTPDYDALIASFRALRGK